MTDHIPDAVPAGLTDLEEALNGPDREAALAHVLERLEALRVAADAALRGGLPAADYARCEAVRKALAAAHRFVITQRQSPGRVPGPDSSPLALPR